MELILVLHNIRSVYNVGAILRTAEGLGAQGVICSGYTPCPLRPGLMLHLQEKLRRQLNKTALGAEEMINLSFSEDILQTLRDFRADGFQILGLENRTENTRPLGTEVSEKVVLILGEEVHGIPPELLRETDFCLEIPMRGQKESFNVSVAAGIAMYELLKDRGRQ